MTHTSEEPAFRFVDLFAGIGGFHAALSAYGGECRYAVEIDPNAARVYEQNWGMDPRGDITADANDGVMNVPAHDILTAGTPCQPFSKSGAQRGMDETRGTLWFNTLRIVQERKPSVVLIENVRNLAGPRHKHEWDVIVKALRQEGYRVADQPAIFSPHLLPPALGGRPQVRERVFVTATHNPDAIGNGEPVLPVATMKDRFQGWGPNDWDLATHLPLDPDHHAAGCDLTKAERLWIDAWDDLVQQLWEAREGRKLPGFPIWADHWVTLGDLKIPEGTPDWKRSHLIKNAEFYTEHKRLLDRWAARWGVYSEKFPPSRRKLEWQAQDTPRLWDCVLHFRPSGIRAKKPSFVPALVAITQTSIVGPRERRLSPREAARLQSLPEGFDFSGQPNSATYRQLGNGVNIGVVWHILRAHVERDRDILETTDAGRRIIAAVDGAPDSPDKLLNEMFPVRG